MKRLFVFYCLMLWVKSISASNKGFINCPVADLFGQPPANQSLTVPVCGYPQASSNCPRLHQLLFNEPVTILDSQQGAFLVRTDSSYFITTASPIPKRDYWIRSDLVTPLDKVPEKEKIPGNHSSLPTITLARPWYDRSSGTWYSAGTRFTYSPERSTKTAYTAFIYDCTRNTFALKTIATDLVLKRANNPKAEYVQLIRDWMRSSNGSLAYVWGGTSIARATKQPFTLYTNEGKQYYDYSDFPKSEPRTGCDCSGLVWRAAHTVGIPYQCKNSYTLAQKLPVVTTSAELEVGDLLWIAGHVMIVADLEKHTLIEARSYKHGYGKIHEIPLSAQFKGIETYQQLLQAQQTKRPLERLDAQGAVTETIKEFKLLSFPKA